MWPRLGHWLQIVLNATAYLAYSIILSGPFQWSAYQPLQTPRPLLKDQHCRKSVCSKEHSSVFFMELWTYILYALQSLAPDSFLEAIPGGTSCLRSLGPSARFTACCRQKASPIKMSPSERARGEAEMSHVPLSFAPAAAKSFPGLGVLLLEESRVELECRTATVNKSELPNCLHCSESY